ncbi:MAG: carbon storage regulator [Candidatus Peribacteraceae bacterium]|mgnify:CR=1 FL=1|jgi:carbon storage regulator|nr:carbon storage regulator [bacterium]MDP6561646.1 carbon storage regulator [Candidatus Peribacteraceae bacterium]|tara:strand:- start:20247 stop:20471 length:225 start_codon:yes stop_codon:yes gene_type:complete
MLVLSRKKDESIRIGHDITITVIDIGKGRVKIGIDAPDDVRILRGELLTTEIFVTDAETVDEPPIEEPAKQKGE